MPRKAATKKNGTNGAKNNGKPAQYAPAPCELTPEEVADRADQLANLMVAIDQQREALKAHSRDERIEIKQKELHAASLRDAVLSHREMRDVEVETTVRGSQVVVVRLDTGEVLEAREATDADRQGGLFG